MATNRHPSDDIRRPYAYLDFCVFERCNLTCAYCRTNNEGVAEAVSIEDAIASVNVVLESARPGVFKVSGYGEASLWGGIDKLLAYTSSYISTVQVMTNGTMNMALLSKLCRLPNIVFCITIDGLTHETNAWRCGGNRSLHDAMWRFADIVVNRGHRLEINCVMTRRNIDDFPRMLKEVWKRYKGMAVVQPFPVRPFSGLSSEVVPASVAQVSQLRKMVLDRYDEFAIVLPGQRYMERLLIFMDSGKRLWPCHVPRFNYGVGPRLRRLVCPCLGHTRPSWDKKNQLQRIGSTAPRNKSCKIQPNKYGQLDPRCRSCFTHYESLNIMVDETASGDDLRMIPSFRNEGSLQAAQDACATISNGLGTGPFSEVAWSP
ncbi:MAG: radical SAM protein [Desulfarculaceae bacterium]|nr:radical SAM protein [Desulfarculaceae bacterium]